MTTQSGLRLFGVAEVESGTDSIAPGTTLVNHRGLGAIVEPAEYSSAKLDDAAMERYATIIEEAFRAGPVLPAPLGTVFKSHGTLTHWLELHYFTLTDAMSVVEGHVAARVSIGSASGAKEDAAKTFKALGAEALRLLRGNAAATVMPVTEDGRQGRSDIAGVFPHRRGQMGSVPEHRIAGEQAAPRARRASHRSLASL